MDFRSRVDKFHSYFQKEKYEKILKIAYKEKNLSDEELSFASMSISRLEKKINNIGNKNKKEIQKMCFCSVAETSEGSQKYWSLEDPYFSEMKKNEYFYNRSLIEKVISRSKMKGTERIFQELLYMDPRPFTKEFVSAIFDYLKYNSISVFSIEKKEKLINLLHYFASMEETDFKNRILVSKGENINLRSGPGTENPNIGKLKSNEFLFVIDSDLRSSVILGKTGVWLEVIDFSSDLKGWVFSAFTEKLSVDNLRKEKVVSHFPKILEGSIWDFNEWKEDSIPENFTGNYIKTKSINIDGNVGFVVWEGADIFKRKICKKTNLSANSIDFRFKYISGKGRVLLFLLNAISGEDSYLAYKIEVDPQGIIVNENRVILEKEKNIHELGLKIFSYKGDFFLTKLEGEDILLNLKSHKLDNLSNDKNLIWEICITQSTKQNTSSAAIFGFKFLDNRQYNN
ncbi:MAG: SH3 domain-containing protein [Leptospiraceae bacterium]|nr:SH3 domain-containing protein [Leptospiraceae bacterium]MCK6382178.1 SH3 domain-containing protein [Leptospiraceae bacterium]